MAFRYATGTDDPRAGMWEINGDMLRSTALAIEFRANGVTAWLARSKIIITPLRHNMYSVAMPDWMWRKSSLNPVNIRKSDEASAS